MWRSRVFAGMLGQREVSQAHWGMSSCVEPLGRRVTHVAAAHLRVARGETAELLAKDGDMDGAPDLDAPRA